MKKLLFSLLILTLLCGCNRRSVVADETVTWEKSPSLDSIKLDYSGPRSLSIHLRSETFDVRKLNPSSEAKLIHKKKNRIYTFELNPESYAIDGRFPDPYPERKEVKLTLRYYLSTTGDDGLFRELPGGDYRLTFTVTPESEKEFIDVDFSMHSEQVNIFSWN